MKEQKPKQRYLLRTYVYASSAEEALKLGKKTPVQDVILQDKKEDHREPESLKAIGFPSQ